jgi:hypothetical protein
MRRQRPAGERVDLESPYDAGAISGLNTPRRGWIDSCQCAVKPFHATTAGHTLESLTQGDIPGRARKEPAHERAEIEPGATSEHRQAAAARDVADDLAGVRGILRRRVHLGGPGTIHHVVSNALLLVNGNLVSPNVDATVDRGRITRNHLAIKGLGDRNDERALSGGRWPDDGDKAEHDRVDQL